MVLLADKASDDGSGIWASKQRMADELCASNSTVLNTIAGLIADGLLEQSGTRKCANGFTVEYTIIVDALEAVPVVRWHSDQSTTLTGQPNGPVKEVDVTSQRDLPDQSTTLTQTSLNPIEPSSRSKRARDEFEIPDWVPVDPWNGFVEFRRSAKGGGFTPRAAKLIVGELDKLRSHGHDPGAVLDQSTRNSWKDVYELKDKANGQHNGHIRRSSANGAGKAEEPSKFARAAIDWCELGEQGNDSEAAQDIY